MAKLRDKILTAVFAVFLTGMLLLLIFLPKQKTSVNEKRTLADVPKGFNQHNT